jgi:hypothetical protein
MKEYHESHGGKFFKKRSKYVKRSILPYNYGRYIIEMSTNKVTGSTYYHVYQFEYPSGSFSITEAVNCVTLEEAVAHAMKFKADRNESSTWPFGVNDENR